MISNLPLPPIAEEALDSLRLSETRYRRLFEAARDGILILDATTRKITDVNPFMVELLGYSRQEFLDKELYEIGLLRDADTSMKAFRELQENGYIRYENLPLQTKTGEHRAVEFVSNVYMENGREVIQCNIRDITARQVIDERLRLLESVAIHANDTIIITEAGLLNEPGPRILYVNQAFTRMTGYESAEVLGRSPRFLQGPETAREPLDQMRRAIESCEMVTVEVLNYRKDGTDFWAEMSLVPIVGKNGEFTHWISIQRDITERRRSQQELQAAKEEAERANRAKSEFLSRMSHELRTPLNAILGFGQLLGMAQLASDDRESVDQILRGGRHLLNLINEVLDIAQIEAGHLNLSLESVHAGEICVEALALVRPLAKQRGIILRNFSPLCALRVVADQQRLKQILLNLLSNAVKYNRLDGTVTLECKGVEAGLVRLSVQDEGAGIPADKQHRVFIPFDRIEAHRDGIEGTGVGLALSRRLAEGMGGALNFSSEAGQGSTFWVDLPLADGDMSHGLGPAKGSELNLLSEQEAALIHQKVLCIEDNLANLRLLERLLKRRPVEILSAQQGQMGLELARQRRPALILLDLQLPDISGLEALLQLRSDPLTQEIPVVVLSADALPNQIQRLLDAGAQCYLTKPLDVGEFFQTLDQILLMGTPIPVG